VRCLGLPDRFVMHAERDEQLVEVGLDVDGITAAAVELSRKVGSVTVGNGSMATHS
jgi:1-deoxy-D-xylulose-5-phosphate synthase